MFQFIHDLASMLTVWLGGVLSIQIHMLLITICYDQKHKRNLDVNSKTVDKACDSFLLLQNLLRRVQGENMRAFNFL